MRTDFLGGCYGGGGGGVVGSSEVCGLSEDGCDGHGVNGVDGVDGVNGVEGVEGVDGVVVDGVSGGVVGVNVCVGDGGGDEILEGVGGLVGVWLGWEAMWIESRRVIG